MHLGLHVMSPPVGSLATRNALLFARAALSRGHQVPRVFFSGDGVLNGSGLRVAPRDEFDVCAGWIGLHKDHGTELILCVSACHQRGILSHDDAVRAGREGGNLATGFVVAGLGQLAELMMIADRVVTFG